MKSIIRFTHLAISAIFSALIGSFYKIGLCITNIGVGGYMHGQELKMGRG